MKLEYSGQTFEKYSNIEFNENLSSRRRAVPCGRTDRHDEANSRFSLFCERTLKQERNVHIARCNEVTLYTDIVNG